MAEIDLGGRDHPTGPGQITIYDEPLPSKPDHGVPEQARVFRVVEVGEHDSLGCLRTGRYSSLITVREQVIGHRNRDPRVLRIAPDGLVSLCTGGLLRQNWYVARNYYFGPSATPPSTLIPANPNLYGYPSYDQPSVEAVQYLRDNLPRLITDLSEIEKQSVETFETVRVGHNSHLAGLTNDDLREARRAAEDLVAETAHLNRAVTADAEKIGRSRRIIAFVAAKLRDYAINSLFRHGENIAGKYLTNGKWLEHLANDMTAVAHAAATWLGHLF